MANIVAYPDISLEKFTGLDPSDDVADFLSLIERKIEFSLGLRPGAGDAQNAYDARRKALFGSVLRGPAAQWFDSLPAAEPWDDVRTGFLDRFTDEKDKYRKRIEVENIRRQSDELIKSYVHRLTKAVEKGWPHPFTDAQRQTKCMEFFVRGLTPPALKQKAHQFLIETPHATWEQLNNHVSTKDLSFAVSSDFTGTASSSIDNKMEIDGIKDQLQELSSLMKNNRISAAYNPNEPRNKQNHTRFCKFCRKSGHTIAYCYANRDFKEQNRQQPQQRDKFRDNYQSHRGRRPREDSYDRNQNSYRQDNRPRNSYYNQDNRRQYSPHPRSENNNFRNRSQSFENRDRRYSSRSNDRRPQDYRNYTRERQYDRNDSRTRYRESNSPRQDYRRSNSSNQNSRDNSRDRNSNRVQFRENKVNGFFVDNQQDEINLN